MRFADSAKGLKLSLEPSLNLMACHVAVPAFIGYFWHLIEKMIR